MPDCGDILGVPPRLTSASLRRGGAWNGKYSASLREAFGGQSLRTLDAEMRKRCHGRRTAVSEAPAESSPSRSGLDLRSPLASRCSTSPNTLFACRLNPAGWYVPLRNVSQSLSVQLRSFAYLARAALTYPSDLASCELQGPLAELIPSVIEGRDSA